MTKTYVPYGDTWVALPHDGPECPHCGSSNVEIDHYYDGHGEHYSSVHCLDCVECENCGDFKDRESRCEACGHD